MAWMRSSTNPKTHGCRFVGVRVTADTVELPDLLLLQAVDMLVRLAPGAAYPPHTHAGDKRVWSETGCTCVLITSTRDVLS
jgi:hypothetical protein